MDRFLSFSLRRSRRRPSRTTSLSPIRQRPITPTGAAQPARPITPLRPVTPTRPVTPIQAAMRPTTPTQPIPPMRTRAQVHQEAATEPVISTHPDTTVQPSLHAQQDEPELLDLLPNLLPGTLDDILSQESYQGLLNIDSVVETLQNPLGNMFFTQHIYLKSVMNKSYKPSGEDILQFCNTFQSYLKFQKREVQQEIEEKTVTAINRDRKQQVDRHFSSFNNHTGIQCPDLFAAQATLTTDSRIKTANSTFPVKAPFTGRGPPYIQEFLQELNTAQHIVNLSKPEFMAYMRKCTSGEPYQTLTQGFHTGLTIADIYQTLMLQHDNGISADEASTKLLNLRASRDMTFPRLVNIIQNLSSRSCIVFSNPTERTSVFNITATAALKRSLPHYAKLKLSELSITLGHELGMSPTFHQLTAALYHHLDDIDSDIKNNGMPKSYNENLSLYRSRGQHEDNTSTGTNNHSKPHNGHNNNTGNRNKGTDNNQRNDTTNTFQTSKSRIRQVQSQTNNRHQNHNNHQNQQPPKDPHRVPLGDNNKKFCGLCHQSNHSASDYCRLIRDDQGRQVRSGLSTGYCNPCFKKYNLKMHHPEDLCPGRPQMMNLYREKKVYPAGVYKETFLAEEANQTGAYPKQQDSNYRGRIHAIKVKQNPGKSSILSVDNSAAHLSNLTSKLYVSCQVSKLHLPGDYTVTGLYDTGADQSIISRSFFGSIFKLPHDDVDSYLEPSSLVLSSYTNTNIPVSGEVTLLVQLHFRGPYQPITFLVAEDLNEDLAPLIFGINAAKSLLLGLKYDLTPAEPTPFLYDMKNPDKMVDSQFLTDLDLSTCTSTGVSLDPYQSKFIPMMIDHHYGLYENMEVIISEDNLPSLINGAAKLHPTKCSLELNQNGQLFGHALVTNNSSNILQNIKPTGFFENAFNYETRDFSYDYDKDRMFIHDIHVFKDATNHNTRSHKRSKINLIRLDPHTLPVYTQRSPQPARIYMIDKIFPEQTGYIPNPDAVNNDVPEPGLSLTDFRHPITNILETTDSSNLAKFEDSQHTIELGLTQINEDEDLQELINEPRGYTIPEDEFLQPADMVNLEDYPPEIRPYIRDIFVESYPSVISTHSTDRGDLSRYLGNYTIKLKPGQVLPQHKKLYYLSSVEKLQMQSILEFLLKNGTIERASLSGDTYDNYASPAYLIAKADKNATPRLIVNFQQLNPCLQAEPALLPTADVLIHSLRNKFMFSSSDMANAFHSITLDPACRDLTLFSTPLGSFRHCSLPTGIKTSPESLSRFMEKVLHWDLELDATGQPIMENDIAKMVYSPIPEVQSIYDDFIIGTEIADTYLESVDQHFKIVKKVIGRIATHKGKISLKKSQLGKSRVNFFGIFISHNFVCVDQRRIQKLLDAPMPNTPKLMRGFLGLLNSLRSFLRFDILSNAEELTPLTSTKCEKVFTPTTSQVEAFNKLKTALASGPIFSKLIDIQAPKVILTDSAGNDRGSFSAVLAQIVKPQNNVNILPPGFNFEDSVHQILYDHKVPIKPLPLRLEHEDIKAYKKRIADDLPPEFMYLSDPNLGYSSTEVDNSLGIALQLQLDLYSCQTPLADILKRTSKIIRGSILRHQFIEFVFGNDKQQFNQFIKKLEAGQIIIDSHQYIFSALATAMYRPIIVVSNVSNHKPITEHAADKTKPAFVFLLYGQPTQLIVRPGLINKHNSFNLSSLRSMFEIVSYASKRIGTAMSSLHIIDLELMGVMYALTSFAKIIGKHSECVLLTDAKCVYYLFNSDALAASAKLQRWNYKILEALPQLKLSYLRGQDNLADWLSRAYSADLPDLKRLALPTYVKQELDDVLPSYTIFTQQEWKEFVNQNPGFLGYFDTPEKPKVTVRSLSAEKRAIGTVLTPLQVLRKRINMETVVKEQKMEYSDIYTACLESQKQKCKVKKHHYYIKDSILFTLVKGIQLILIPTKLLPVFISYTHLLTTHAGEVRMNLNLQNFFHPNLKKLIRNYCKACYGCQSQNSPTKLERLGMYVTITRPFETISLDFIQSLPPYRRYNHILTATCQLTGTILLFPMKTLTSREFINTYMFNIHPMYSPVKILCDSATAFLEKQNLIFFASINVQVLYSSSYFSASKGLVESANKQIKWAIIKILAAHPITNWVHVLPLVARLYNTTKCNKTSYTPLELLFGSRSSLAADHFGILPEDLHHPLIQNERVQITKLNNEISERLETAKAAIDAERTKRIKDINKTRVNKEFQIHDIVLARNFSNTTGVNHNLRPIFHPSPHRIIETSAVSAVTERITDRAIQKFNNNDIKKYTNMDESFNTLPPEILDIVSRQFTDLTDQQMADLALVDTLPLPVPVDVNNPQPAVSPVPTPEPVRKPDTLPPVNPRSAESDSDQSSDEENEGFYTNQGRRLRNTQGRQIRFQP